MDSARNKPEAIFPISINVVKRSNMLYPRKRTIEQRAKATKINLSESDRIISTDPFRKRMNSSPIEDTDSASSAKANLFE